MCLVCLFSLPFLDMQIDGFLSNIIRGACYVTTSGLLFNNLLFSILKWARDITEVHTALYSLSELDLSTGPGICVQCLIVPL